MPKTESAKYRACLKEAGSDEPYIDLQPLLDDIPAWRFCQLILKLTPGISESEAKAFTEAFNRHVRVLSFTTFERSETNQGMLEEEALKKHNGPEM